MRSSCGMASVPWKSWAVLDRRRTKAISMYLAGNRDHFLRKLPRRRRQKDQRRNELLRVARRAFRLESADVQRLYFRKVAGGVEASGGIRRRLREKQAAPAHGGGKKSGGVEASGGIPWGGIQASHGVAKFVAKFLTRAPTTPVAKSAPTTPPIRCRSSSPGPVQTRCEEVPSMNGDLHVPDAHTRDEAQAVGGGQHEPYSCIFGTSGSQGALPVTTAHVCTQTIAPDQQMLACGDVTAGRLRTPSWGQHFEIRGSGPQAKVHSCIVSHIVDLRALYGDIAAADVLGASLRCLHLFESALGLTDSRGTESGSQVRGDKVASQVKAAAILGLAIKMVVSTDCTDKVPVARLWAKVAGNANVALVKALEIQLVNQWPGLVLIEY